MLVKIFGAIDVLAGIMLILGNLVKLPIILLYIFGIALLAKSLLGGLKDIASWMDASTAAIIIISIFVQLPFIVSAIFALIILQKGVLSFAS
jgi:hypothetical protein